MAIDGNGFWYPEFPDNAQPAASPGTVIQGTGAPDNALGQNGNVYVNVTNGDIYTKSGDVWNLVSGGTGAAEMVVGVVDDPNGVHTPTDPTKPAVYYRDSAGNDNIQMWRWSVADQEWKETIVT